MKFVGTDTTPTSTDLLQLTSSHLTTKDQLLTSTGTQTQSTSTLQSTTSPYIGCLRQISIDGNFQNPQDFEKLSPQILLDSCQMLDRCNPNPCEHNGKCKQNSKEFECVCDENYTGATCHMPLFPLSCEGNGLILILYENLTNLIKPSNFSLSRRRGQFQERSCN